MNTVLSIPSNTKVKKKAEAKAKELGISFSDLLKNITNAWLEDFAEKKTIGSSIQLRLVETPTEYFKKELKKAKENRKKGKSSPIFTNPEDAIKWLNS